MATILVVDDDPIIRRGLAALLPIAGHTVLVAADGAEALEVLDQHTPDLILVDLQMPVLDGRGFVQEFRARGGTTPIVVMSGVADVAAATADLEVEDALKKPVALDELLDAITRWSRSPDSESPSGEQPG